MRGWLTGVLTRLGQWSLAHALIRCEEYAFDYVLYPFMLYRGGRAILGAAGRVAGIQAPATAAGGYVVGFALLLAASVAINLIYLRLYDGWRTDWFGFEALKGTLRRRFAPDSSPAIWRALVRYGGFLYLAVWHSPLFATLFLRDGEATYVMTPRDWRTFWVALALANFGWAGLVTGVVEVGRMILALRIG